MSFKKENNFFKLMNNSVYGKTINLIMTKNISHIKMGSWDGKEAKKLLQKPLFYNVLIEKSKIKCLKYIDLLHELPFCDD